MFSIACPMFRVKLFNLLCHFANLACHSQFLSQAFFDSPQLHLFNALPVLLHASNRHHVMVQLIVFFAFNCPISFRTYYLNCQLFLLPLHAAFQSTSTLISPLYVVSYLINVISVVNAASSVLYQQGICCLTRTEPYHQI